MAIAFEAPSEIVEAINFRFYSHDEVRKLSVKKITRSELLDAKGIPVPDGLYDPAMGAVMDSDSCKSCGQLAQPCPGHCGHIELVMTLYNPLLFNRLKRFLQITCFHCHKFRINEEKVRRYVSVLKYIRDGDVISARSIEATALSKVLLSTDAEGEDMDMDFEVKRDVIPSYKSPLGSNDTKRTWTSLQYAEGIAILSKFMKENHKKCANCGKANPRITSPTFGWLNKTEQSSDIRANIILNAEVGLPSNDEDRPDNEVSSDDSQSDEEFSAPANASEQSKNMTADFFEEMFSSAGQKHLLPSEAEQILGGLWENEPELCMLICNIQQNNSSVSNKGYAMFFLKDIIVPPCKFRLPALGGRGAVEHPQNVLLAKVQESNIMLQKLIMTDPMHVDTIRRWMDLQRNVNVLYDSSKGLAKSERDNSGIRQLLEKKTGILRQKMMGKRVNFACRSVISPDPCLAVNEIGIPPDFALKLTYPERVTPWNVHKMRHAIMNGANIYPGASHYVDKDRSYKLQLPRNFRSSIARKLPTSRGLTVQSRKGPEYDFEGKIVYRHIQDGDIVLVNRQPTLHKPSTMAHVVRVLKREKTLRMHYANCSTYNADFDGDEMNVHFPQDEISRSEAINIVNANKQYIVPTSGDPIRGLIQDHIVSAVLLSKKDLFLTREEYHQLLYASCPPPAQSSQPGKFGQKVCTVFCHDEIQPLSPAIWKPKPLWTGNQVIAAILCHITSGRSPFTVEKEGRIPKEYFAEDGKESKMYISNNDFIHGMIDKAQFGKYGLVHTVHELYGADIAGTLLSIFSRLFTTFLHMNGFTCGVDDLLLLRESDKKRKDMLEKSEALSEDVHFRFAATKKGDIDLLDLHREIEKILRSQGEPATVRLDRMMSNALNLLTSEVNKALFPNGLQKPFPKNCLSLMTTTGAKGGLVNLTQISSLLGQQELEGKRVPRIISGKTLPCFPPWDTSCRAGGFISDRFLTGLRPQEYYFHCMAGRDGLVDTAIKTARSGYLQRCLIKSLESLKVCYDYTVRDADGSIVQFAYGEDGVDVLKASYITELEVLVNNQRVVLESLSSQLEDSHMSKSNDYIKDLPDKLREKAISFARQLSEKGQHCIKQKDLMKLIKLKYMSSLADPGEAVGVIAAQSIGEPSTQMTLNTFHLAGRGEMNVTLGIPRLQEILKSAKENIRTPIMTCPLLEGKTKDDGERLAAKLRRICLADLVQSINVSTLLFFIHQNHVSTLYKLKMKLYPSHLLPQNTVELEEIMAVLRTTFVDAMEVAITKHLDLISKISYIEDTSSKAEDNAEEEIEDDETGSKSANGEDNGGEKDDDEGDDDYAEDQGADAEKRKRQKCDEMEYEDGIEKEKSPAVMHDLDGGVQSGSESDQGEVEDDFEVGRDDPKSSSDEEMPDSRNKMKPLHEPEVSEREKKTKKVGRGKKKTKKVGRRKKIDSVIFVEAKGNIFEAHFKLTNESHILLAEIAQKTAQSVYVKQSKNIDRCSVVEPKRSTDRLSLQTAGVNFLAFWDMQDHLDIDRVVTNNIHAMLNTYGVEAARATIINEVKAVFDPYGIKVNTRHLSLIADFMSAHGGYRPMNMIGMNKFNTSPFGKMTFETATRVIVEAAFYGEGETLESPSASISLGRPVKFGTGVFDLMQKI